MNEKILVTQPLLPDIKNYEKHIEDMLGKICDDLKEFSSNKDLYYQTIQEHINKLSSVYSENNYLSNIERFYRKEYDFLPNNKNNKEIEYEPVNV